MPTNLTLLAVSHSTRSDSYINWTVSMNREIYTGCFVMFSVITNIYNKKTKGPTLMEFFTATGKLKKFFLTTTDVRCVHHGCTWHTSIQYSSSCHTRMALVITENIMKRPVYMVPAFKWCGYFQNMCSGFTYIFQSFYNI
jgi:hypothetical protein